MKNETLFWAFVLTILLSVFVGVLLGFTFSKEIILIEISPTEPDNALEFYVDYLQGLNYTVTERDLSTNTYETVDNFKEFLWLLEYGGFQECYVDYGAKHSLFSFKTIRYKKLWLQLDGVFWELRID